MKAVVLHRFNDLDSLTDEEVPTPVIGRDEVLVQAQAQAVDPVDYVRWPSANDSRINGCW